MTDENQNLSDFLNDDDEDAFDIERLAREFEENSFDQSYLNEADDDIFFAAESDSDSEDSDGSDTSGTGLPAGNPSEEVTREVFDPSFDVSPAVLVEGMLFVGNPDNRPITAEEMAALMRNVSADEIDELVGQLNQSYRETRSPFEIIYEPDGYRLVLAKAYEFCRQRFYREEKAATLSQPVVDVLSLVAYLQPVTKNQIEKKRLKPSSAILNQLVRRRLIEVERKKVEGRTEIYYRTTNRFLDLFDIDSLDELPQSQTFDAAD